MLDVLTVFESQFMRRLSFLVFLLCVLVSFKNQNAETKKGSAEITLSSREEGSASSIISRIPNSFKPVIFSTMIQSEESTPLQYDYYNDSCPRAEKIIRSKIMEVYKDRPSLAPALLRLVFHDCFIEGCDASVLLDAVDGNESEKDSPPNLSLKGFDIIEIIKEEIEKECPGTVSCADILVLAARECVLLTGGPFYPLSTGRRDGTLAYPDVATYELPSPGDDISQTLASFATRGFDERETATLLGAHSIGTIHCKFFRNRLYNFDGTDKPDPSVDKDFLNIMRAKCNTSLLSPAASPASRTFSISPSSSMEEPGMEMDYNGPGSGFGTLYYQSLLQGKGILYADQQMMAREGTASWVKTYASDALLFRENFAMVMMKLSNLGVLTAPFGQTRLNCSKVV